jgi:hypothetical protein
MYNAPENYAICDVVKSLHEAMDQFAKDAVKNNYEVTPAWAKTFNDYLEKLEPLAESGDPWAQYNLAVLLWVPYIYSDE